MSLMENWIVLKTKEQKLLDQMFSSSYVVHCKQCISSLLVTWHQPTFVYILLGLNKIIMQIPLK